MTKKFICAKKGDSDSCVEYQCISPNKKYFIYGYYEYAELDTELYNKDKYDDTYNLFVYFVNLSTGAQILLYKFENITNAGCIYESGPITFIFSNCSKYLICVGSNFDVTRNYYNLHTSRNYLRIYKINLHYEPSLLLTTTYNDLGNNMYMRDQQYFSNELNMFYYCDIHQNHTYTIIYKVDFNKSVIRPEIVYKFMNKNNKKTNQSYYSDKLTKSRINIDNICATSKYLCILIQINYILLILIQKQKNI